MTESRQVIIGTKGQEIKIFKMEGFNDPFTDKRVDVEFVRKRLNINF